MSVMDLKWDSTRCSNVFVTAELRVLGLDSLRLLDGEAKSGPDALQEFCLFKGLFSLVWMRIVFRRRRRFQIYPG